MDSLKWGIWRAHMVLIRCAQIGKTLPFKFFTWRHARNRNCLRSKRYPKLQALNNISLTIEEGEFFGLLGPNGAGKTTLIHILAGLTRADGGRVRICGRDTLSDFRAARRMLGVVPQELVFDPFFTVR